MGFAMRTCQYCNRGPLVSVPACAPQGPAGATFTFTPSSTAANQTPPPPDTEFHFLMECKLFTAERSSLFSRYQLENNSFQTLSLVEQFKALLCPTSAICVKLVHRFVKSMFVTREKYDEQRRLIIPS